MSGRSPVKRPGADVDAWVWQSQTIADLAAFVEAHGPASKTPLPVLCWRLGVGRSIGADLPSFEPDARRLAALDAYAGVLGTVVTERVEKDRIVYTVRGRIGRPEGTDKQPRVSVIIQATVWLDPADDDADGGASC
jgi:hypothetical protein